MTAPATFESDYRVLNFGDDGEYLLLYDVERDDPVWVTRDGYDDALQQVVDRLYPGFLVHATLVDYPDDATAADIKSLDILTETTLSVTRQIDTLPMDGIEETWAAATGDDAVVTTVEDDDGQVIYEIELLPDTHDGVDVFEALQTGEWSLEPWYDGLEVTGDPAQHIIVARPQERPYTAIIGFPHDHPAHEELYHQLIAVENQYQEPVLPTATENDSPQAGQDNDSQQTTTAGTTADTAADPQPEAYEIEGVQITPAPADSPAAYQYADLQRAALDGWQAYLLHAVYWPLYFVIFPLHLVLWAFVQNVKGHMYPNRPEPNLLQTPLKLKFFLNQDRARVYLRASMVLTPTSLLPWLAATTPIPEDSSKQRPPQDENWPEIRQAVFERDNHHCVNCGAAGGPHGDAQLDPDHVQPKTRGGPDHPRNLRTLCRPCHQARHARIF